MTDVKKSFDIAELENNSVEHVSKRRIKEFDVIVRSVGNAPSTFLGKNEEGNLHAIETEVINGVTKPVDETLVEVEIKRKQVRFIMADDYAKHGVEGKVYSFFINEARIMNPTKSWGHVKAVATLEQVDAKDREGNVRTFTNLNVLDVSLTNEEHRFTGAQFIIK